MSEQTVNDIRHAEEAAKSVLDYLSSLSPEARTVFLGALGGVAVETAPSDDTPAESAEPTVVTGEIVDAATDSKLGVAPEPIEEALATASAEYAKGDKVKLVVNGKLEEGEVVKNVLDKDNNERIAVSYKRGGTGAEYTQFLSKDELDTMQSFEAKVEDEQSQHEVKVKIIDSEGNPIIRKGRVLPKEEGDSDNQVRVVYSPKADGEQIEAPFPATLIEQWKDEELTPLKRPGWIATWINGRKTAKQERRETRSAESSPALTNDEQLEVLEASIGNAESAAADAEAVLAEAEQQQAEGDSRRTVGGVLLYRLGELARIPREKGEKYPRVAKTLGWVAVAGAVGYGAFKVWNGMGNSDTLAHAFDVVKDFAGFDGDNGTNAKANTGDVSGIQLGEVIPEPKKEPLPLTDAGAAGEVVNIPDGSGGEQMMKSLGLDTSTWYNHENEFAKAFPDITYRMSDGHIGLLDTSAGGSSNYAGDVRQWWQSRR